MKDEQTLKILEQYLAKVPGVRPISYDYSEDGHWRINLVIDIHHPLAWHVVQEFGHVLNDISIDEPLPTVFKPLSPPPYMNGGPADFLSWVIESKEITFTPALCFEWLEGRLPRPVDDLSQWPLDE